MIATTSSDTVPVCAMCERCGPFSSCGCQSRSTGGAIIVGGTDGRANYRDDELARLFSIDVEELRALLRTVAKKPKRRRCTSHRVFDCRAVVCR